MSYRYADDHHQPPFDYHRRSRRYAAGVERSVQYRRDFQPYDPPQSRQPTCWDPPWMRTTAYSHSSSYEPDLYLPPPPRRRPTCWDPPVYWETPGQRPFQKVSVYDHPPNPSSCWNQYTAAASHPFRGGYSARQPVPRKPSPAITETNQIDSQLDWLSAACDRMESRLDALDQRVDNLLPPEQPGLVSPYNSHVFGSMDLVQHHPPSRNSTTSLGPSDLSPNASSVPPHLDTVALLDPEDVVAELREEPDMVGLLDPEDDEAKLSGPEDEVADKEVEEGSEAVVLQKRNEPNDNSPPPASAMVSLSCNPEIREQIGDEDAMLESREDDGILKASSLSPVSRHEALKCIQIGQNLSQHISIVAVKVMVICYPPLRKLGISGVQEVVAAAINAFAIHCQNLGESTFIVNHYLVGKYYEGRRSSIQCVFDPGGDGSSKLLLSLSIRALCLWFPP